LEKTVKLFRRFSFVILLAVLALLACGAAGAQDTQTTGAQTQPGPTPQPTPAPLAPANDDSGAHFAISPYLWFAGAHGTAGALGRNVSVHASPGDLLSHFDIGLMGAAEYRYNRYVLTGDLMWIRLSDSKALPFAGLGAVSADFRAGELVWTSKMGYRVINSEKIKTDFLVGARFWHFSQKLSFNPSLLGININPSQNWVDFVLGGRVQLPMGKKTVIDLAGDVGGWGAQAKLDYQFATLLGYKLCDKWTSWLGYRYLFIDYRRNNGVVNMVTSGALLGLSYTFR
jgi:hypothetical protein